MYIETILVQVDGHKLTWDGKVFRYYSGNELKSEAPKFRWIMSDLPSYFQRHVKVSFDQVISFCGFLDQEHNRTLLRSLVQNDPAIRKAFEKLSTEVVKEN